MHESPGHPKSRDIFSIFEYSGITNVCVLYVCQREECRFFCYHTKFDGALYLCVCVWECVGPQISSTIKRVCSKWIDRFYSETIHNTLASIQHDSIYLWTLCTVEQWLHIEIWWWDRRKGQMWWEKGGFEWKTHRRRGVQLNENIETEWRECEYEKKKKTYATYTPTHNTSIRRRISNARKEVISAFPSLIYVYYTIYYRYLYMCVCIPYTVTMSTGLARLLYFSPKNLFTHTHTHTQT